jgi:tetratricopeptide (TPR) repeat protein
LAALRREPAIAGLTERLVGLEAEDWNIAVTSLVELDLISNQSGTLDAHPLLREYFAAQLRDEGREAWTEGHRRLFEYLCESTEHQPDGIDGLQPLYQAVAHGCQAGLHRQACDDVYTDRILRGTGPGGNYSTFKLGAIGADLGAVACFFDRPWRRVSPKLSASDQAWLLNEAAFSLRALGRLTEAVAPMRAALEMGIELENWERAAAHAGNLSELELTLGEVSDALADAEQSVTFADRSKDWAQRMGKRGTHGDALHQAGRRDEARRLFADAENIQLESQPEYPWLYSVRGFRYCDLLLSGPERMAWRLWLEFSLQDSAGGLPATDRDLAPELQQTCDHVTERATQTLEWAVRNELSLLDIALDHLTLARATLYRWLAEGLESRVAGSHPATLGPCPSALPQHLTAAVDGLREAGSMHHLPRGLLTRAWLHHSTGNSSAAASDLDEAWEIAARGPMPLFQSDILLTRARLFFRDNLDTAEQNLTQARRLIEKHGYHRRDEELEDAEAALAVWKSASSAHG